MNYITTKEFVLKIWECFHKEALDETLTYEEICAIGRERGWLSEQELSFALWEIDRRSAARIIHEFMRIELGEKDIPDWNEVSMLKDLYDCRACASHVAFVCLRNIMPPKEKDRFDLLSKMTYEEAESILNKVFSEE